MGCGGDELSTPNGSDRGGRHLLQGTPLLAEAGRYDDDALVALANRGLLRRGVKLLPEDSAEVRISAEGEAIRLVAPEWTVTFLSSAPAAAGRCECATAGACQHLIAAILYLRRLASGSDPAVETEHAADSEHLSPEDGAAQSETVDGAGIRRMLVELTDDELLAWTRKADGRWARTRAASLDSTRIVVKQGANLSVNLPAPYGEVFFMGPSLDAAIVKPTTSNDRRTVGLAVLAVWLLAERELANTDEVTAPSSELVLERQRVTQRAIRLATDLLGIGLLHLGNADQEHLDSLSASARGTKLYRLAILAERASDHVAAMAAQTPTADTGVLLDQLAEIHVLADRIHNLLVVGHPIPDGLLGRARAQFEDVGHLDLFCIGHYRWGTSKFGGVSAVFIQARSGESFTLSKPTTISGQPMPAAIGWEQAATVEQLSGHRLHLANAKASVERRLSAAPSTSLQLGSAFQIEDLDHALWAGSIPALPSRLSGRMMAPWAAVAVTGQHAGASFDRVTQRFVWPLTTTAGRLDVVVPFTDHMKIAVDQLESLAQTGAPQLVMGRLGISGRQVEMWPISVLIDGSFLNLSSPPVGSRSGEGLEISDPPTPASNPAPDHIQQLEGQIQALAERGVRSLPAARRTAVAASADAWGLGPLADILSQDIENELAVLRAAWVMLAYRDLRD